MKDYTAYLKAQGNSSRSIATKIKTIRHFLHYLQSIHSSINTLTYAQVMGYIKAQQQRGNQQRSIQLSTGFIKQYLNWLVSTHHITHNPVLAVNIQGVQGKKLYSLIEWEELEMIYNKYETEKPLIETGCACPPQELNNLAKQRNKVILGLFIYQGISTQDLGNISPQHVHIKKGLITVPGSRRSNERTLKLEASQLFELHEYITEVRPGLLHTETKESDQLILSKGGKLTLTNSLSRLQQQLTRQYPFFISFKQLRASVISKWLKQYNLRKVQYMVGHRYVSSTEKYQRYNIEDLQQLINAQMPVPEE